MADMSADTLSYRECATATGFAFLSVVMVVLDVCYPYSYGLTNPVWFRITSVCEMVAQRLFSDRRSFSPPSQVFGTLSSILAFAASMSLWFTARARFSDINIGATYGYVILFLCASNLEAADDMPGRLGGNRPGCWMLLGGMLAAALR